MGGMQVHDGARAFSRTIHALVQEGFLGWFVAPNMHALDCEFRQSAVIDDEMLSWANTTLGVGSAVGKIDEIREELAPAAPAEPVIDPVTDPTTDLGDEVVTAGSGRART